MTAPQKLRLLAFRRLRIVQQLVALRAALVEEAEQRTLDRGRGIDLRARIGLADVVIPRGVVEVPVGVDDRGHRPAPRPCIIQDRLRVHGRAAGVDHDQSARRIEDDGVAVWSLPVERDPAGNEMIGLRGCRRAKQEQGQSRSTHRRSPHVGVALTPAPVSAMPDRQPSTLGRPADERVINKPAPSA
jgi:hypothetical protein